MGISSMAFLRIRRSAIFEVSQTDPRARAYASALARESQLFRELNPAAALEWLECSGRIPLFSLLVPSSVHSLPFISSPPPCVVCWRYGFSEYTITHRTRRAKTAFGNS